MLRINVCVIDIRKQLSITFYCRTVSLTIQPPCSAELVDVCAYCSLFALIARQWMVALQIHRFL